MKFAIDLGTVEEGPWLNWHARESLDGEILGRNWSLRGLEDHRQIVTDTLKRGVALDLLSLRTGWNWSTGQSGVAPRWLWNESVARFAPRPADEAGTAWKKGLRCRIALSNEQTAVWEQSGAAPMVALQHLAPMLQDEAAQAAIDEGKIPVIRYTGAEVLKTSAGSTAWPVLQVVKWVARLPILDQAAEHDEPAPAAATTDAFGLDPIPPKKPASAIDADLDDNIPF